MTHRPYRIMLIRAALALGCAGVIFRAGVYAARASASTVPAQTLSYAGLLQKGNAPLTTPQTLVFSFKKAASAICESPQLNVTPDNSGRFQVAIPLASCPGSLWDGSPVSVDISMGTEVVASNVSVTPVPYALHADQLGTADCPSGYDRDTSPSLVPAAIACARGNDHLIRVGTGNTVFWIDRYESSIWSDAAAKGQQYGVGVDYPGSFPLTGQGTPENQLYAVSKRGVSPSGSMTWFQASRACRASGKRLPTNEEWTEAAWGTPNGTNVPTGICHTNLGTGGLRLTGEGQACVSNWGVEDMVGNAAELIAEWGIGVDAPKGPTQVFSWPTTFGTAKMWGITSVSVSGTSGPLEVARGGAVWDGAASSVFSIAATQTVSELTVGFRCLVTR